MIVRDASDGRTFLIKQEDHADLSAQFAAHWGNRTFARPAPNASLVAGTAHHDGHFREIEWALPIDSAMGRPFGHRTIPFSMFHLEALERNIAWLDAKDRYAALLVSMHHTGLPQNRYGVINSWQNNQGTSPKKREMRPEMAGMVKKLEAEQEARKGQLGLNASDAAQDLKYNYHLLQVFDLMSLYLCSDGYDNGMLCQMTLDPVPLNVSFSEIASLRLLPTGDGHIRLDPYPFDQKEFTVSLMSHEMIRRPDQSPDACKDAYWRSDRRSQTWTFVP